jgi:hypothetical protein
MTLNIYSRIDVRNILCNPVEFKSIVSPLQM